MMEEGTDGASASIADRASWTELDRCPICKRTDVADFETHHGQGEPVKYKLCGHCGSVYQSPRMTEQALSEYYRAAYVSQHQQAQGVSEKELRVQSGRASNLLRLLRQHRAGVERHLDIGSSAGVLMESVHEVYGCASVGIEPSALYRAFAAAGDLRVYSDLEQLANAGEREFDLVSMAHVLEHLPDPVGYLRQLRERWMTPKGTLLVEVPNLFGHFSLERPHLFCFHAATLKNTLAAAGWKTVRLITHGAPRSRMIPLYLTAIAEPAPPRLTVRRTWSGGAGVRIRRRVGMAWHRLAPRLANRWAWLPLPELRSKR